MFQTVAVSQVDIFKYILENVGWFLFIHECQLMLYKMYAVNVYKIWCKINGDLNCKLSIVL